MGTGLVRWFLFALATLRSTSGTGAFAPCYNAARSLGCADSRWIVPNGALKCSTFGSESCASELVSLGSSACAHQELRVVPNLPCQVSGVFYAPATCLGPCTLMVVVCPGKHTGSFPSSPVPLSPA